MERTFKIIVAITVIALISFVGVYYLLPQILGKNKLIIYVAGSLVVPFQEAEKIFEENNPGIDVVLKAAGSRELAKKIVDLGEYADIYTPADYKLIEEMLYPDYAEWYLVFARNEIVLAYTPESAYANEINQSNWFYILNRTGVTWGHSDPDLDPCGYRALLVLKLAEIYYNVPNIYKSLRVEGKEVIRPKSVDLIGLLESGDLDYAFEYKSVAVQHNLSYVELPAQINLGYEEYHEFYSKVNITLSDGTIVKGEPILYGLTILKNSRNKDLAVKFIKTLIEHRDEILDSNGQPSVYPLLAFNYNKLPEEIKEDAKEWKSG